MSQQALSQSRRGRHVAVVAVRVILGLFLIANAPVGTLIPTPPAGLEGDALMAALWRSPFIMVLAKVVELSAGVSLVSGRFVALALTVFAPVLVNIVFFEATYAPQALPLGLAMVLAVLFLAWNERDAYRPLLRARRPAGVSTEDAAWSR